MDDVSFVRVSVPDIRMIIVWRGSHSLTAAQLGGFRATFFLFCIAACINLGGSVIIVIFVVTFYVFYFNRWANKTWKVTTKMTTITLSPKLMRAAM